MKIKITGYRKRAGCKLLVFGTTDTGKLVQMTLRDHINDLEFCANNYDHEIEYDDTIFDSLQVEK